MPSEYRRRSRRPGRNALLAAAVTITATFLGCAGPQPDIARDKVLERGDEQWLWRRTLEEQQTLLAGNAVSRDRSAGAYVNQVIAKLRPAETEYRWKFRAYILDDPFINAFAYPNGVIFISTGLLARLENEAQLASLLAHEMAHCTGRHALRTYRMSGGRSVDRRLERDATAEADGCSENRAEMLRGLELEADAAGLDMLMKAHYDPQEALNVFKHQRDALATAGATAPRRTEAHPHWQERMKALKNRLAGKACPVGDGVRGTAVYNRRMQGVFLQNGRLNLRHGRFRWAQQDLRRYLDLQPGDAAAHCLLGETLRQEGSRDGTQKALEHFQAAIRWDGSCAAAYKAIGVLHFKQGRRALARKFLETGLALAPEDADNAFISHYLALCRLEGE